jgi:uncharacterized protein (TIGR02453 family)
MDFSVILRFLQSLSRNNNRDWFEKNKGTYLTAKDHFDQFLEKLLAEMSTWDDGLSGLNPRKLAFRIYRDVRFSRDKRPYKTNMGAGISPGGKMVQDPGYYVHIEPGNKSMIAGGVYMPDAANLAKIRQEIDYHPDRFMAILNDRKFKKNFPQLDDFDKLKTAPKGFPKDHPLVEILKHKSFIVSHGFTDAEVKDKKFLRKISEVARKIKPLNDFLREAIS